MLNKSRTLVMALATLSVASCGLMELANLDGLEFQLPETKYSLNTADPRWKKLPGGIPAVACGPGGPITDCCKPTPTVNLCTQQMLSCMDNACGMTFKYEEVRTLNLAKDVAQLGNGSGQILGEITLKKIDVNVNNGLNVAVPPVNLYVAPMGVTSSSDARAQFLARVPSSRANFPAGFKGVETVELTPEAQQAFAGYAADFKTPFNLISSTEVVLKSGATEPSGQLDVGITGTVSAKF